MRVKTSFAALLFLVVTATQAAPADARHTNQQVPLVDWYTLAQATEAARKGDVKSQLILGDAYMIGDGGLAQNSAEGLAWYEKAARQGYAPALRRLGYIYRNGEGVERDEAVALQWYLKAAELGDSHAQWIVGLMYGSKRDMQEAYFWLLLATRRGNKNAARARDYTEARLTPKERSAAVVRLNQWRPKRNQDVRY